MFLRWHDVGTSYTTSMTSVPEFQLVSEQASCSVSGCDQWKILSGFMDKEEEDVLVAPILFLLYAEVEGEHTF